MIVQKTWDDRWNDVVRYEMFPDAELRSLMCIPIVTPPDLDLRRFITEYFVEDAMSDVLITNQDVVVLYYTEEGSDIINPDTHKKYLSFDIYVKNDRIYDVDPTDRMRQRTKQIAQKLKEILSFRRYVQNMQFRYVDDYVLGSKLIGYSRHHITFAYFTT